MRLGKDDASSVKRSTSRNSRQQQPITLYMIVMELENDLMKLRSHFAKVITKVFGISQK
jgi:hypothetical protein